MTRATLLRWLREDDPARLKRLFARADAVRRSHVGDEVHLRGLIEISSHCIRQCAYCGLRRGNSAITRYRLEAPEVLEAARRAAGLGYGTVVLQAGEDPGLSSEWVAVVVGRIKAETGLAVTLSLGERPHADLAAWRHAGADRYLLRFETSDRALFRRIHPPRPGTRSDRIALLRQIRDLGYEVGSGIMVGLPGQTLESIADDLLLFRALDLDMIGVGPFIPHPGTPLGQRQRAAGEVAGQVTGDERFVCRVMALTRLVCPEANIPSTTALATLDAQGGREAGLRCGGNVVMPNLTPERARALYEIYPGKGGRSQADDSAALRRSLAALGRTAGRGPGGRAHRTPGDGPPRARWDAPRSTL